MTTAGNTGSTKTGSGLFHLEGWRPFQLIFALGFLLYGHTLSFDIVGLDDDILLLNNRAILSAVNIGKIFSSDVFMSDAGLFYRPLLNISLMFDTLLGGPLFFIFHLSNVLLFLTAASLVFLFLVRLGRNRTLALTLSLLFLCHPALAQVAAWIPGRNDSLLLIFALLSFMSFQRFLESSSKLWLAGYLLFFMAAIFTKETAIVLPLLAAFYITRVFPGRVPRISMLAGALGSALILLIWYYARAGSLPPAPALGPVIIRNVFLNFPALIVMLGKTVFPFYPSVWLTLADANLCYGLAAAALLAAAVFSPGRARGNMLWFGLLWYTLFLLPTSIVTKGTSGIVYIWEHRLCLPIVGFLIFVSELNWVKSLDFTHHRASMGTALTIISLACISFMHSYNFSDRIFFWERAVEEAPSAPAAHLNLGVSYYLANLRQAAERQYLLALAINPNEPIVHNNLGVIYADSGATASAEAEFMKELKINPGYQKSRGNLAALRSGNWAR
jgi:tetratricopeptide (TPR) repeat protein